MLLQIYTWCRVAGDAFSPLFYGIRDVTCYDYNLKVGQHVPFSPLFYGIRDVT